MTKQYWIIGCEESQAVCLELRKLGHIAYSCDLKECSGGKPEWHIKMDIFEAAKGGFLITQSNETIYIDKWDGGIMFPECTHIAVSGAKHFAIKIADGRQQQGIDFFIKTANLNIKHLALENPIGIMSRLFRKPDQII